ncbi:helix-turn-helix transcriptional regulator [Amycolatopsis sp. K13G38]|uniref:Helix-turn-helix transcriptional regulator n=1 Tax=Amycolatopsis acididurans TaxID=2724524 RepID=A0ABX1JIS9_9PSEU|nr:helix-turn-helix transcriptional regulator [Amycolatopsis acididurans]NKQ58531.1 helix-turn-helix transcriptional regulator [Amycolatopsis acididurans]
MNESLAHIVGERVRFYRTTARKAKTVVAGLAGITPDYLYQIERGQKLPTLAVLAQLAEVLGVGLGDLVSRTHPEPPGCSMPEAADAIYRALTCPLPPQTTALPQRDLHREVLTAWHTWQTSPARYSTVTAELPGLIVAVREGLSGGAEDGRKAQACAADMYGLLRTVAKRIGRTDLSLLAADRAVCAAEAADDPVRVAGAQWNMTQVLLADHQYEGAEETALRGVQDLGSVMAQGNPDAAAMCGSLRLIAAVAAARRGNEWVARERLHDVVPLAGKTGERNACWTAFGPTNVAMYAVNVEVETGEAVEGLRLAERVEHGRSPSIERRVAFLIDQARGYQQRRDYASALVILQTAEAEAPEDLRHRPAAHQVMKAVVNKGNRTVGQQTARLAGRVGVLV